MISLMKKENEGNLPTPSYFYEEKTMKKPNPDNNNNFDEILNEIMSKSVENITQINDIWKKLEENHENFMKEIAIIKENSNFDYNIKEEIKKELKAEILSKDLENSLKEIENTLNEKIKEVSKAFDSRLTSLNEEISIENKKVIL